ncbi:MAG: RNA polymerase sigma factor, partial [Planctomycetes bacterium]|nr:RNA polymerase sigma factor [Planctomycetota bacterium]
GHADAIRQMLERFQGDVFGLCFKMLNHRQDAEDVVQEVFVRVFRSLNRWDSSRPLKPWIMGITVNRCRTWLGKRSRLPELVDYLQDTPGREEKNDGSELLAEIRVALSRLRPDFQAVFVMFHEQGQSYEEIALAVERPVGTVKTWLHRARQEVLDQLRRRGMMPDSTGIPLDPPSV